MEQVGALVQQLALHSSLNELWVLRYIWSNIILGVPVRVLSDISWFLCYCCERDTLSKAIKKKAFNCVLAYSFRLLVYEYHGRKQGQAGRYGALVITKSLQPDQ